MTQVRAPESMLNNNWAKELIWAAERDGIGTMRIDNMQIDDNILTMMVYHTTDVDSTELIKRAEATTEIYEYVSPVRLQHVRTMRGKNYNGALHNSVIQFLITKI